MKEKYQTIIICILIYIWSLALTELVFLFILKMSLGEGVFNVRDMVLSWGNFIMVFPMSILLCLILINKIMEVN